MLEIKYYSPLKVPDGTVITPKAQRRYDSGFPPALTLDEALQYLEEECRQFPDGTFINIYSNTDRLNVSKLRNSIDEGPGVCCEVIIERKSFYLFCHQWGMLEHNVYALHLTLRALHNIVKWGVADYPTVLVGFAAEKETIYTESAVDEAELISKGQWMATLRLDNHATLEDANASYRHHAKIAADNEEALLRLNQAIEAARKYFAAHP